jgi:drug/metabolite transporter (DMT)-like permease
VIAHRTALLKGVAAIAIFATVPAAVRTIGLNSPALGIVRLTLATAGMTAILAARRSARGDLLVDFRHSWRGLAMMGFFFGLHWLTYFIAIKLGSPSMSELGFSTYGAQLPLLGWAYGFGRPRAATIVGVGLALAGSCLCLWGVDLHSAHAGSLVVGVISGTLYAALPLLHQRYAGVDVQLRTWAQFAFALPLFLLLAPAARWSFSALDVLLIVHLGLVVTLVGHYLWVQATTVLPIQTTGVVAYLQLPMSLTMNYLLIGVPMTGAMALGAALIVAANALAIGGRRPTSKVEGAADAEGVEDAAGAE